MSNEFDTEPGILRVRVLAFMRSAMSEVMTPNEREIMKLAIGTTVLDSHGIGEELNMSAQQVKDEFDTGRRKTEDYLKKQSE